MASEGEVCAERATKAVPREQEPPEPFKGQRGAARIVKGVGGKNDWASSNLKLLRY